MQKFSAVMLLFILTGCSTINYNRTASDGSNIQITGWSIGTDAALSGLNYSGDVKFSIESASADQTKLVESIVTGAVKGMK